MVKNPQFAISLVVAWSILLSPGIALGQQAATSSETDQRGSTLSAAASVDPSGTWIWEQQFGGRSTERSVTLSMESGKLSGTYGSLDGGGGGGNRGFNAPAEISNAKLDGDKISFDVTRKFGPNEFTTSFAGVISGDEIAGLTSVNFGGQLRQSAWMAKRILASPAKADELIAEAATTASDTKNSATSPVPAQQASVTQATDTQPASPQEASSQLKIPEPMRIPSPGESGQGPYAPRAILPGGIVIPLYPPGSPELNAERVGEAEVYNLSKDVHGRINSIVNIHNPSIEVHFASPSMNTGAVVILAAGGGHRTLNVGTESADFVPFFYNYGVNTVILRNRLRSDGYEPSTDAVHDALQAIRLVRKHAEAWKFDPQRIGIMGFSAGAELSAPAAIQFAEFDRESDEADDPLAGISSRPDFVGIIYPGPTPFTRNPELEVPRNTPPAFIASAGAGDRIHAIWATDYFSAMLRAGIPNVEMHIYGNGYHPGDRGATGGLTHRKGIPFGTWQYRFIEWFDDLGFLSEPGTQTKAATDSEEFVQQPPRQPRRRPN